MNFIPRRMQPSNPFSDACHKLREMGYSLLPSDIIGLTLVNGDEMTIGQVISFAKNAQPWVDPLTQLGFNGDGSLRLIRGF